MERLPATGIRTALLLLLLGVTEGALAATDIELFVLGKGRNFIQSDSGTPSEVADEPYNPILFLEAVSETSVQGVSITPPGEEEPVVLQQLGREWELPDDPVFQTRAELDANVPNGDYLVEIDTANTGTVRETLTLSATEFPPAPRLKSHAALQAINPEQNLSLAWDAWPDGSATDVIRIEVEYADDGIYETMALDGTATGIELPASIFASGRIYRLTVVFIDVNDSFTLARSAFPTGAAVVASSTTTGMRTTGELQPEFQHNFYSGNRGEFSMSPLVNGSTTGEPHYNGGWWHTMDLIVTNQEEYPPAEDVTVTGPDGSGITNEPMDHRWQWGEEASYRLEFPEQKKPLSGQWTILYDGIAYTFTDDIDNFEESRRILVPTVTVEENGYPTRIEWSIQDPETGEETALPDNTVWTEVSLSDASWDELWEWEGYPATTNADITLGAGDRFTWAEVRYVQLFTVHRIHGQTEFLFWSEYAPTNGQVTDIAVTDLSPSTTLATLGESIQLTATVENRGNTRGEGITVLFGDSGTNISIQALSLEPGASGTVSASWTPVAAGTYDQLNARLRDADDDPSNDQASAPPVRVIVPPSPLPELLTQIEIYAGIEYGDPDTDADTEYVFGIDIAEAGEHIQSISVQSPGDAPAIMIRRDADEEGLLPGGQRVATSAGYETDGDRTNWELEVFADTAMEDLFGAGTYTLTAEFLNGTTQQATLWFGEYTAEGAPAGTDLPTPRQAPLFSSPSNRAIIKPSEVTISLEAVTDPAVNAVHLEIENVSTGTTILETLYPDAQSHSEILSFTADGVYEIAAANGAAFGVAPPITTADGIPVTGVRYTESVLRVLVSDDGGLPLAAGWNLLGMFADTEMSLGQVLEDSSRGASLAQTQVYAWDRNMTPHGGYKTAPMQLPPEAGKGYWVLCDTAGTTAAISGSLADNRAELIQGWNVVAPAFPGPLRQHPDIAVPAWTWDAAAQRYRIVGEDEWLQPGTAYWLFARQPVVDLPLTED